MKNNRHGAIAKKSSPHEDGLSFIELLKSASIGLLTMVISAALLLLIGAVISYNSSDPGALEMPLAATSLYGSMLLGGIVSAKLSKENKLLSGLIFSAAAFALMFLFRLIICGTKGESMTGSGAYFTGSIGAAFFGALISIIPKSRKAPSKKKRSNKFSKKK